MRLIGALLLLCLSMQAEWERSHKLAATNAVIAGAIIGWGVLEWDYGALSTYAQSTVVMEIGDATSPEHGFSYEDAISNLLGAVAGYGLHRYPALAA